jgi:hypothetical protein
LLKETSLEVLKNGGIENEDIYIFVPMFQLPEYEKEFPDIKIVGVKEKGIGKTRTFIRNYFAVDTRIIMIDDDIREICSIEPDFDSNNLNEYFTKCFEKMDEEKVKFAGFCPYDNEYYMKTGYSLNPKYTGGHLILEYIRENPIVVHINHFEDYVANALYFLLDSKLMRFNGTYVKTKYFNPNGGIIDFYGGLSRRKLIADKLSHKLSVIFQGLIKTSYNKTHQVTNLKLNSHYKISEKSTKAIMDTYKFNMETLESY